MASGQGSFADIFVGTKEVKEAYTLIGWIAVNHARMEQHLDYLQWQLDVFQFAGRPAHRNKTDAEIRDLSKQYRNNGPQSSGRIQDRVRHVTEHLTAKRASQRLSKIGQRERVLNDWTSLGANLTALTKQRNEVVHSAVSWSAGSVMRESTWSRDLPHLPLDLDRDNQLNASIGAALTNLQLLTTDLAQSLPFKGDHTILTGVARL
jgi:ribosomal protein L18E